jgi:hypothetical protein
LTKIGDLLPWVLALPAAVLAGAWTREKNRAAESRRALFAIFLFGLLLLSLSSAKRGLYLVPIFPAFAVTIGWWLASTGVAGARRRLDRPTLLMLLLGLSLAPAGLLVAAILVRFAPLSVDYPIAALRQGLSTPLLLALGAAAICATSSLLWLLARHLRAGSTPPPGQILVPLCLVFLAHQLAVRPLFEPVETLRPLTQAAASAFPAGTPVAAYRPGEELLGIIYFHLGRRVLAFDTPADVQAYLTAAPRRCLVYEPKKAKQFPEDVLAGLQELYNDSATATTPYVIAVWTGEVHEPPERPR